MARKFLSPLNLLNLTADPGTATEGDIYWNSSTNKLRVYFDGAWADASTNSTGSVTSITAGTGLTGGTITTSGTLAIDTSVVPRLNVANTFTAAPQQITVNTSTNKGLIIKGATSQSANLQEWQNSAGIILRSINSSGSEYVASSVVSSFDMYSESGANNTLISVPNDIWADKLRFRSGTYEYSADGSTSWTAGSFQLEYVDGRNDTGVSLSTTNKGHRWTWNYSDIAWSTPKFVRLTFSYTNPVTTYDVTVEASSDGATWASKYSATGVSAAISKRLLALSGWAGENYVRITLINNANTNVLPLRNIEFLSYRPGDQGGAVNGIEENLPLSWTSAKTVVLQPLTATAVALVTKGYTSQSANLQEWQNSGGTVLAKVDSAGSITAVDLTLSGNLTVNGTTTNLNSTNLVIEDKNIILGDVATPTNTTADGGGISLLGATNKTITWDNANSNWTSSENWNIPTGKVFKINNVETLSATTVLGITPTVNATGFSIAGGTTSKTFTLSNTLTLAGTDGSTLNIGSGGTLGTGAFATIANYAPLAGSTFTGQIQSTLANSATTGGGQIYLNGATGNRIDFNQNGVAAPSLTTRSAGTKIVLWPNVGASTVDYAIGIEGSHMWYSVDIATGTQGFKWYAATTNVMTLRGNGALSLNSTSSTLGGGSTTHQFGVVSGAAGNIGLVVRGATSQTGNLSEWQNSAGTILSRIDANGTLISTAGIQTGSASFTGVAWNGISNPTGATTLPTIIVRGISSQTADLQQWQNSGGTSVATMSASGAFTAVTKSFDIPHPIKDNMRLRYGSLEGPENGVYVRGKSKDNIIELPDYWTELIDENSITVNITAVGSKQKIYVNKIENNKVYLGGKIKEYFFTVFAERKDVDKLMVEY